MDTLERRFKEENSMKCSKRRQLDEDELVVKVTKSSGREKDIIVRSTHKTMTLAGDDYVRFRIIQPRGHEKEEIVHRVSRTKNC